MSISEALLPEYDNEMALTRKTLERVPEGKTDWKPHEKSMTMGRLAAHIAEIPSWAGVTIGQDSFDIEPPGGSSYRPRSFTTSAELLAEFDKNVTAAREAIAGASDEQLLKPWSLLKGGQTVFTMPRIAVVRGMVMNHAIHHRSQLGVYLRLNDIPVPSVYGPSADDPGM